MNLSFASRIVKSLSSVLRWQNRMTQPHDLPASRRMKGSTLRVGATWLMALAVTLMSSAAHAQTTVIYQDDFESGTSGWSSPNEVVRLMG